jgi:predicted 3-demethylubiquinone-9 3-methyltransferase (glyoxalase superfamily)
MQKISPFLWFNDQAEEAAKFYVSVFKKSSKIVKIARYGEAGPGPEVMASKDADKANRVMAALLPMKKLDLAKLKQAAAARPAARKPKA